MVEMKKVWSRPLTVVQSFEPNEYCASSCGDRGTVYKFKCDANSGGWFSDGGLVYLETNGREDLQIGLVGGDRLLSAYYPCGDTHEAPTTDEFLNGYLWSPGGDVEKVIVWRGPDNNNTHCTKQIDKTLWETAKS